MCEFCKMDEHLFDGDPNQHYERKRIHTEGGECGI